MPEGLESWRTGTLTWLALAAGLSQAAPPTAPPAAPDQAPAQPAPQAPRPPSPPASLDELIVTAPSQKFADKPLPKLNLDPNGRFTRPAEPLPYLRQRPVNGCKLMAGGATSLIGEAGVAGGLVCTKRF